ncbi:MAG: glycoside hydrolase family 127 protein [Armatimonadota bacterium]
MKALRTSACRSAAVRLGPLAVAATAALGLCASAAQEAGSRERPVPFRVAPKLPDAMTPAPTASVRLQGYLGDRVAKNADRRLPEVDVDRLLAGFRKKPGEHPWIGEHIGKWMHAATLAWVNTGDPKLKSKLDYAVAELVKTQEPDGYLGTYLPDQRFGLYRNADWDVWSHKYDLMGLLTYHQYTGNAAALEASRKVGDLLIRTFGPGKKSILAAGTHVGMASTSVLQPMVLLYRLTGDDRYLEFSRYIVRSWDEEGGPKVLRTLLTEKSVQRTGNGKAYEMLSNLVGLCELARVTGEREYLQAAINAWDDVVANQLYLTGSTSHGEHFHDPHDLPNHQGANVGETCVSVTWIQLNSQLLRLTGRARYGDELERTFYNHLAAAQRPDGREWCYYTSLEGIKPYGPGINCCVSSGPRGMALAPQHAYLTFRENDAEGLAVNLLESSTATVTVGDQRVKVEQQSSFPAPRPEDLTSGRSTLTLRLERPASFPLKVRVPAWAERFRMRVPTNQLTAQNDGWLTVPARSWKDGDRVELTFGIPTRIVTGEHSNAGKAALTWGPIVLAYDERRNPELPHVRGVGFARSGERPFRAATAEGIPLAFRARLRTGTDEAVKDALFVPFAEAGSTGGRYAVWLPAPGTPIPRNLSLLAPGRESRSREGNVAGSIVDGDEQTFVVTFNAERQAEDWFAVELEKPAKIGRVVYSHGRLFHDGGWFDASAGKPRIEARLEKGGPWVRLGTLDDYPATTATDPRGLKDGQSFTLRLPAERTVYALRVIGKPAHGDNPAQAFSSCGELQAFAR